MPPDRNAVLGEDAAFVRWRPDVAAAIPELAQAVGSFDPVGTEAGARTYEWLVDHGLDEPPEAVPYLLLARRGELLGFYALANGHVELTSASRKRVSDAAHFPRQPAVVVTQFARAVRWRELDGELVGQMLIQHAFVMARRAAAISAATVMVVEPFDREVDELWRDRYGFRRSRDALHGGDGLKRLWRPLVG
jgi:hypothetical protein